MKCKEVSDLISWYVDGCLPPNKAEAVRLHIEGCACCRAEMSAEQVSARALCSPVKSFDAPDVLAQVRSRVGRKQMARPRWQWAFAGVAAACCLTWLGLSLVHQNPSPQQTATSLTTGQVATAPQQNPAVKRGTNPALPKDTVASESTKTPTSSALRKPPKRISTKPRTTAPERVLPEPKMEYLVVYKHPGLGDGVNVAVNGGTGGPESGNPASSSYSIRMTDESTGLVTDVSAYSNSDGETEESAEVKFQSETPDVDEPERSSADEKPLHITGSAARSDLC